MTSIPIVQGTAVSPHHGYQQTQSKEPPGVTNYTDQYRIEQSIGESHAKPERSCQDAFWAILFVAHLVVVLVFIIIGLGSVSISADSAYGGILTITIVTGAVAIALSTVALTSMMSNTELLVQISLIFSVLTSLAIGIAGFVMSNIWMGVLGIISFLVGMCYAKLVWNRIPFAASNLRTALTAVQANLGLALIAYAVTAVAFVWTLLWFLGLGQSLQGSNLALVFVLFLSYYWVHQVLQNTMHVTTAGVIGTWWFVPDEASSFWSRAVSDSWFRAITYSFGSICFGSFLVAFVQALRALEHYSRGNDDMAFLSCIIQCILSCLQSILEEVTKFAYVYVGLYGFSFLEAGRNVIQLFQQRGWTVIITDDLADNVLFMMSVAIGLASGLVGFLMGLMNPNMLADLGMDSMLAGFLIGLLAGFLFSTVLLSIVGSAVNTVIVCYAEAPNEFELNHPHLSAEMRSSWTQAWPELF